MLKHNYLYITNVKLRQRLNIKLFKNENVFITDCMKIGNKLVFASKEKMQLIIYNLDVNLDFYIGLYYQPWFLTKVDSETVAVSCSYGTIRIVEISRGVVMHTLKANILAGNII